MPCCNKDPGSFKHQAWEIIINVLCSLLKDTATGVLIVEDMST